MVKRIGWVIGLVFSVSMSQVQLLDDGYSGIVLGPQIEASGKSQFGGASFQYIIESRFSLGVSYGQSLKDTLFEASSYTNVIYNSLLTGSGRIPYPASKDSVTTTFNKKPTGLRIFGGMELIEPDKINPLSVSMHIGYSHYDATQKGLITKANKLVHPENQLLDSLFVQNTPDGTLFDLNQNRLESGLHAGWRFYLGDKGTLTLLADYTFQWVKEERTIGSNTNDREEFWNDVGASAPLSYMFSEIFGMYFTPQVTARLGSGDPIIMGGAGLGLVVRFP